MPDLMSLSDLIKDANCCQSKKRPYIYTKMHIEILPDNKEYQPGQCISGRVWFNAEKPIKTKGIFIRCHGRAKVKFYKEREDSDETELFTSRETYIDELKPLVPDFDGCAYFTIGAGQKEYPFSFNLPRKIPSSFHSFEGDVTYSLKVVIKRSSLKFDHTAKKIFTVKSTLDLNEKEYLLDARKPVEESKIKFFGLWRSGPILATARIDRTGYACGETIFLEAQIENQSGKELRKTKVVLKRAVLCRGTCHRTTKTVRIDEVVKTYVIGLGDNPIWDRVPIQVPKVVPSGLLYCSIIDIYYILQLVVDPGRWSSNLVVPLDIMIGSVPIRQN